MLLIRDIRQKGSRGRSSRHFVMSEIVLSFPHESGLLLEQFLSTLLLGIQFGSGLSKSLSRFTGLASRDSLL